MTGLLSFLPPLRTVRMKHFDNPFDDYEIQTEESLITHKKPNPASKIVTTLDSKWKATLAKLKNVDYKDYSVYTGISGIALLKLLKDPYDKGNLLEVKQLLSLGKLKNKRHTFLCGDAGPLAIGAVVAHRLGRKEEMEQIAFMLLSMNEAAVNSRSDLPSEYLYGRAGYLYALLYVNANVEPPPIPRESIREVITAILSCGETGAEVGDFECPLMYDWHDSYYLGAAHGVSGILYLLLQAKEYLTEAEMSKLIKPTIDYLATLKYQSGNYPSSLESETDKLVQWCHGAPGFVYLFSIAYRVFGSAKYLQFALEAGDVVWKRGLVRKGYSLCHGVSGNAYSFLELYQTTSDEKHLYRGIKFGEWCIDYNKEHEQHSPDRPLSLFEGIAGPMYFLLDIQNPSKAAFPGFTL